LESKPQDYEEQETGWAVSAFEVSHSAIAVMLHLRSLSGGGSANSVGPAKSASRNMAQQQKPLSENPVSQDLVLRRIYFYGLSGLTALILDDD
jgi:hypothetical protein